MRYDQIIYYPPFERHSLLLQVSCGCSYNQCAFCNMYKTVDFELIPLKQIIVDQVDSMETTLAHLFPEMTANITAPVLTLVYLFVLD